MIHPVKAVARGVQLLFLAACALVLGLAAPRTASAEALTVTQWGALYYGAPYAVAMAKGYFAENHVEVDKIVGGDGGGTTVRHLMTISHWN